MAEYNKRQNIINLLRYRQNGIHDKRPLYKCVLCGTRTTIDGSISNQGRKLICNDCVKEKFETISQAFEWVETIDK